MSYPIYIGHHLYNDVSYIIPHIKNTRVVIISSQSAANYYLKSLVENLSHYQVETLIFPDGEAEKNIQNWESILDHLIRQRHHRDSTLIALGGGVIGDLTGFAAATFLRGISFIQIPTTLLAQVDASIGGKTGINHTLGKNLIGAFHQPQAVLIDLDTLKTLPPRIFREGLAEIIKAALIADLDFFTWLEDHLDEVLAHESAALHHAVERSVDIKRQIVIADEKEAGCRMWLNLGHTAGHALEQLSNYKDWYHGEAVSIGLIIAATLALQRGLLTPPEFERIHHLLQRAQLPVRLPDSISFEELYNAMQQDKKIYQNQLRFILPTGLGKVEIFDNIQIDEIKSAWNSHHPHKD